MVHCLWGCKGAGLFLRKGLELWEKKGSLVREAESITAENWSQYRQRETGQRGVNMEKKIFIGRKKLALREEMHGWSDRTPFKKVRKRNKSETRLRFPKEKNFITRLIIWRKKREEVKWRGESIGRAII